eukprot:13384711-Ditylum_brightwellii.AAC.1
MPKKLQEARACAQAWSEKQFKKIIPSKTSKQKYSLSPNLGKRKYTPHGTPVRNCTTFFPPNSSSSSHSSSSSSDLNTKKIKKISSEEKYGPH